MILEIPGPDPIDPLGLDAAATTQWKLCCRGCFSKLRQALAVVGTAANARAGAGTSYMSEGAGAAKGKKVLNEGMKWFVLS